MTNKKLMLKGEEFSTGEMAVLKAMVCDVVNQLMEATEHVTPLTTIAACRTFLKLYETASAVVDSRGHGLVLQEMEDIIAEASEAVFMAMAPTVADEAQASLTETDEERKCLN